LREHLPAFAAALEGRGYAKSTAKEQVRLAAEFGRWLERKSVLVTNLGADHTDTFLRYRQRRGRVVRSHGKTLRILLEVLRAGGFAPPVGVADSRGDIHPTDEIEHAFTQHLREERGLSAATLASYARVFRRFLRARFRHGSIELGKIRPDDVSRFVAHEARVRPRSICVIMPAVRVFLRWLHQRGDTRTNLAGCVPTVAAWRLSIVPKALPSEQVARLLRSCDRATAFGRRDYAMLLLLTRLGLRAGEVVALRLDDLDWQRGEVVVRGKGRRQDRLPLPRDVGAAIVAYLRRGRPSCATRRVFVRARAPHQGFSSSVAICNVIERGLKRAGLEPPRKGAHMLRHALACAMLRRGATLAEIGQILRHRSPDTTAIYAKVDFVALRALAPAWPVAAGAA
jgi:site-specific recombinase XerD